MSASWITRDSCLTCFRKSFLLNDEAPASVRDPQLVAGGTEDAAETGNRVTPQTVNGSDFLSLIIARRLLTVNHESPINRSVDFEISLLTAVVPMNFINVRSTLQTGDGGCRDVAHSQVGVEEQREVPRLRVGVFDVNPHHQ